MGGTTDIPWRKVALIIRPFIEADRQEVVALWTACGLVVPWNDPNKDIDRKLQKDPDLFLVGERNDRVIATVMAGYEGHRGWINYLAVSPNHRRQGLGRQMMVAVEAVIRALGCPKINLQVRSTNGEVIDFYRALGYKIDEVVSLGKRLQQDKVYE